MGVVLFRFDDGSKGCFYRFSGQRRKKEPLAVEINSSRCSLAWDQELPQRLWIGQRAVLNPNQLLN